MALFTGSGSLIVGGADTRVYDCEFTNTGGIANGALRVNGLRSRIFNCRIASTGERNLDISSTAAGTIIQGCSVAASGGSVNWAVAVNANNVTISDCDIAVLATGSNGALLIGGVNDAIITSNRVHAVTNNNAGIWNDGDNTVVVGNAVSVVGSTGGIVSTGREASITGNTIRGSSSTQAGIRLQGFLVFSTTVVSNAIVRMRQGIAAASLFGSTPNDVLVVGNQIAECQRDGIIVVAERVTVADNMVLECGAETANTYDGIAVDGDEVSVVGNYVGGSNLRYGINIASGNDNAVYANYLGDASAYGTADFVDNGTATMTAPGANGQFSF